MKKKFGKKIERKGKETEITRKAKNIEEMKRWGLTEKEIDEILKKHLEIIYYNLKKKGEDFEKEFGISREELKEVVKKFPPVAGIDLKRVKENFEKELGISREELREVIKKHPQLVGYNIEENLKPKLELLRKIGVSKEKEIEGLISIAPRNKEICQLIFDTTFELGIKIKSAKEIAAIYERLNYHFRKEKGISVAKFIKELKEEGKKEIKKILKEMMI